MRLSPVVLAVMLAACSAGGVNPAKLIEPKVSVRSLALRNAGLTGGTLDVAFAFHNPNKFNLTGTALTAALSVDGNHFGDVALNNAFTLAETDTTVITVPLTFSWSEVGGAARSILNTGSVNYGVDGRFTVKLPANAGDLAVPFTGQGTIPLLRP